jgi:hypothetical protein
MNAAPVKITREGAIAGKVVFTDGLPGCGKTMMAPIVSAFDRVEMMRYNYALEYFCGLAHFNAVTPDAAAAAIKGLTDLDLYNLMMSREVNFRFEDLSSAWRDSSPFRYVKRLFQKGDAAVMPRIAAENPILHLVSHSILCFCPPLFDALGDRLRIIEVVRHPSYMVKQWFTWMHRSDADPRVFFLRIQHNGKPLPWFAHGWEDLYVNSNRMDRTLYAIRHQWKLSMQTYGNLSESQKKQVVLIPFEQFVVKPEPFLKRMEEALDSKVTSVTEAMLRKQKVPRKMWAEGIGLNIYKHYGWEPPTKGATERDEIAKRRDFVAKEASKEALAAWDELCREYETTYLDLDK